LAVGSSQLPWAHIKDAVSREPVKRQVSLGGGCVYSRVARNLFIPLVPKLDTAAPSARPKRDAGGEDEPASGIGTPSTVERNARPRTASIGPDALNASECNKFGATCRRRRTCGVRLMPGRARASAQPRNPDFFAVIVPGAKSISDALF
jgi:hypothetical protein